MFQMKEQDKNLRQRSKQSGDGQSTWLGVQGNNQKDAQWNWKKNGWTQWTFQQSYKI